MRSGCAAAMVLEFFFRTHPTPRRGRHPRPMQLYVARLVATAAVTRCEKKVRFCALCGPTLRSSGLWRTTRSVHITLTSVMAVQAISARDTHHRHAQSCCSAHRIPPTRSRFVVSTERHGLAVRNLKQYAHAPHGGACAYCIGIARAEP